VVDVLVGIGSYYFLARVMGKSALHGYEPFAFVLVGRAVNGYITASLACYSHAIRGDQPVGTLKMVLSTPTSPLAFILLSSVYPLLREAFDASIFLMGGVLMGLPLTRENIPGVLLIFLLSELAFSSIGSFSATLTLVFKRGDPLLWLFGELSWLLGGVFYPVDILSRFLRGAAQLLPITHALVGMRAAFLQHVSFAMPLPQIEILGLFGIVGLPLTLLAFNWGIRWAKVSGTLSHF
jgi:ABC-2 type transport system permease protein